MWSCRSRKFSASLFHTRAQARVADAADGARASRMRAGFGEQVCAVANGVSQGSIFHLCQGITSNLLLMQLAACGPFAIDCLDL
jgi:hypothetical protein